MTGNTNTPVQSQAQSQKSSNGKKSMRRHLDHLPDLQDALVPFTMVPRPLSDAWINGQIPDVKFKLLYCMLSHASSFKLKRKYLEARFSKDALRKYTKELEEEGYIRVERVPREGGGWENLHHINPISDWAIVRQSADVPMIEGRSTDLRLSVPLNENKGEPKKEITKPDDDGISRAELPITEEKAEIPSSPERDKVFLTKPEDLRPSDYVNMIASKIKTAKKRPGKPIWVPQIEIANQAAAKFIQAHGHVKMLEICDFILERGQISVSEFMFFDVLPFLDRA